MFHTTLGLVEGSVVFFTVRIIFHVGFGAFPLNSAQIITTAGLGKGSGMLAGGVGWGVGSRSLLTAPRDPTLSLLTPPCF